MKIKDLNAFQVLDSRGIPTVAVKLWLENDQSVLAIVPSGASTGEKEAAEVRDFNLNYFFGKSVQQAVDNVNYIIKPLILGYDVTDFWKLDQKIIDIDNTQNKVRLGANAVLGVSLAITKAGAVAKNKPLYQYIKEDLMNDKSNVYYAPVPMMNLINGGAHSDNLIDFQEFMIIPKNAKSFSQAIQIGAEVFNSLSKLLKQNKHSTTKGDEGGFAPNLEDEKQALDYLVKAIKDANYQPSTEDGVAIALDAAASELYSAKNYVFKKAEQNNLQRLKTRYNSNEFLKYWIQLTNDYPIISVEDAFDENDWNAFADFNAKINIQNVGDDLYCTNIRLLEQGVRKKATNAILIKVNQIGSVSETLKTIMYAKQNNINTIISHRSGDTEDTFIADLAIGVSAKQIKTGSLSRSERVAKYNRILEIEQELKDKLVFEIPNYKH